MTNPEKTLISEEDINKYFFGLGVVDVSTMDENKDVDILHAALYQSKPSDMDKAHLLKEMKEDKTFGLTKQADRLTVVELPVYYVQSMIEDIKRDGEV